MDPMQRSPMTQIAAEVQAKARLRLAQLSVTDPSGCILWIGATDRHGYGRFNPTQDQQTAAHRAAWILFRGAIPDSRLVIDHLCEIRSCINPDHLELVSALENNRRKEERRNTLTCRNGHSRDYTVTRVDREGRRHLTCKVCVRERRRRLHEARVGRLPDLMTHEQRLAVLRAANPPGEKPDPRWKLTHWDELQQS